MALTMLTFPRLLIVTVLCFAAAAPASAQTATTLRGAFVDVGFGPHWDDLYDDSHRIPDATLWSGIAVGVDFGRSGVELNVGVPQWHERIEPPQRFQYVGRSFAYEQQGHFYELSETVRRRSIDVSGLYRGNVPLNRHVTLTWLAGAGYVYRPEQVSSVTKEVLPGGALSEVNRRNTTGDRNYLAAIARLDGELQITPSLSVVPRLRFTVFPSLLDDSGLAPRILVTRPELAVRWRF
jgi:hypothetical protein